MTQVKPYVSPGEAVQVVRSGHRVFLHTAAATPSALVQALADRYQELSDVELVSAHTEGPMPFEEPPFADSFYINTFFVGANVRKYVQNGSASYIPMFLSEIPRHFRSGEMPLDVAMVTVSPPDKHGYVSLGISVDISLAACQTAQYIIAEVNPHMPRTHGDGVLHISQIHAWSWNPNPLPEYKGHAPTEAETAIGKHIANLVEDGSTLQMGIGSIPDAVLAQLGNHKDLGVHTEMFSDGVIPLVQNGVINNKKKRIYPNKIVTGFVFGSQKVYDFVDDNPIIRLMDVSWVNDTRIIRKNPKVVAINSAIEVDMFGQVCADSIGTKQYSGVGGQMDFVRGASLAEGGKPILALPSVTQKGVSRIVPFLKKGASVVTTRAHVHYVVTEYGVAYLYGKNLQQRAKAIIKVAHPDHRENLEKAAHEVLGI
ncbi:MAG TPA: 4-hydroxybutyrate CoA-transferase [Cytophagales bacterium]|nr:4-hydroxybutyrate CoA-transferase [Cytophagales bacterium]HAA21696.1 4-hydroxybutyrate CoA-transferase [Cytophagales bacterium]HAP60596.1 4-hydroxybutyrate CoA-transferase [Cytophagales bacterium]